MKTVLFVPGSGEDLTSRNYKAVIDAIEAKGYQVKFVSIQWSRTTITDWSKQLFFEYDKYDSSETILAGFSWGAMTAFVAAAERPPSGLWLFSLSPYFSDDQLILQALNDHVPRYLGKRRMQTFADLDFNKLARQITCKTEIYMGEIEAHKFPDLKHRCEIAATVILNAKLILVPGVVHAVEHSGYIAAIVQNI